MFKIFADHCVHTDLVEALRASGIKVVRALEVSLAKAPDQEIFEYAKVRDFVLLSFDKEFGDFSRFDPSGTAGIVIVYIEKMNKTQIIKGTVEFFKKATPESLKGELSIIEPSRVRKRKRNFNLH